MRSGLVIIDLIEDYFDPKIWPNSRIPGRRDLLVRHTNELVKICRQGDIPIIWVRQEFEPDMSNAFLHARRAGVAYARRGSPGSELLSELDVQPSDTVLVKQRFSAFFGSRLDGILDDLEVDQLILAGITTAWCVRSTAVDAYQRDLNVVLAVDCTDGFTVEDHESSLRAMNGYIARCLRNAEMPAGL